MKKIFLLAAFAAILNSCTKDHAANPDPQNPLVKISLAPVLSNTSVSDTWLQVLGGKASISFQMSATDNLSASTIQDSVNLKDIATYQHDILAGNYNITLNRTNTITADTFIRFNAQAKDLAISKDQAISLPATTADAVITLKRSLIQGNTVPTFTDGGNGTAYKFGVANGYYYVYVKDASTGRLSFTDAVSGDVYLKDITVAAQNRYDITLVPNTTNTVSIAKHLFSFKGFLGKIQ